MIPLKDNIKSQRFPIVNITLIIINIAIFIYELSLSKSQLAQFMYTYGVVPSHLTQMVKGNASFVPSVLPLFTSMFLHGGWFHVLGNMLYLWIFGDNVEDRLGRGRYILLFLAAGVLGALAQVRANPFAAEPIIGASGAIAGILGAYFITYPKARVLTLVPIFFFFTFLQIPAFVFLFIWFFTQWLSGYATLGVTGEMVAWWAHVGGFITGLLGMMLLAPARKRVRNYD